MSYSKGRCKAFKEQRRRNNTFKGGPKRYSKVKVRKVFKEEVTLRWALKEEQAFVELRKKKKST